MEHHNVSEKYRERDKDRPVIVHCIVIGMTIGLGFLSVRDIVRSPKGEWVPTGNLFTFLPLAFAAFCLGAR